MDLLTFVERAVPKVEFVTATCLVLGALALGPSAHAASGAPSLPRARFEDSRHPLDEQAARAEAQAIALRWAPVFAQETSGQHPERDRPLRIDFDGDWDATNDWSHLTAAAARAPAVVYDSVILSATHAFLTFTLFYPRDWAAPVCVPYVCHDNDLEVALLVVERRRAEHPDGLVLVETKTHNRYLATPGRDVARAGALRPIIHADSQGHGLESVPRGEPTEGEVRAFVPAGTSGPSDALPGAAREGYELLSLHDTLWARRQPSATNGRLWQEGESGWLFYTGERAGRRGRVLGASMAGKEYPGGVRPPWALKATAERGDWFLDPAFATLERYARWFPTPPSLDYDLNPYLDELGAECERGECAPAPPVPATFGSSPVALGFFVSFGVTSRLRRRRRGR